MPGKRDPTAGANPHRKSPAISQKVARFYHYLVFLGVDDDFVVLGQVYYRYAAGGVGVVELDDVAFAGLGNAPYRLAAGDQFSRRLGQSVRAIPDRSEHITVVGVAMLKS